MRKYGFIKHSLVNYPGEVCGVIFIPGCNFDCPYCHNRTLIETVAEEGYTLNEIKGYLMEAKQRLITGVCITGGEPTLHPQELSELILWIKTIGLKVKLDTNGSQPIVLENLSVNYIAMDLKTSPGKYNRLTLVNNIENKVLASIQTLLRRPAESYEFRTTLSWDLLDEQDIETIGRYLSQESHWYFQSCKERTDNGEIKAQDNDKTKVEKVLSIAKKYSRNVFFRG